jgi:hypothetical protein
LQPGGCTYAKDAQFSLARHRDCRNVILEGIIERTALQIVISVRRRFVRNLDGLEIRFLGVGRPITFPTVLDIAYVALSPFSRIAVASSAADFQGLSALTTSIVG